LHASQFDDGARSLSRRVLLGRKGSLFGVYVTLKDEVTREVVALIDLAYTSFGSVIDDLTTWESKQVAMRLYENLTNDNHIEVFKRGYKDLHANNQA
jgi:hypothetical protein